MSMATSIICSPNLTLKFPFLPHRNTPQTRFFSQHSDHIFKLRSSLSRNQPIKPNSIFKFLRFPLKPSGFPSRGNLGFSAAAKDGEREAEPVVDEAEEARGQSTMPSRFRYLTKEAPDRPVRWPWLIALPFLVYTWRAVLWELSNWKKVVLVIVQFVSYLLKFVMAFIFHFIGDPITGMIRCIETVLYTIRSIYSGIVAATPVPELTVVIMLTSVVLAIAEATIPDSINNQMHFLTVAGIIGFAAVRGIIPELPFWLLLLGLFSFSKFIKKRNDVSSALPVAAVLAAVGEPWVRVLAIFSYLGLAIYRHSKISKGHMETEEAVIVRRLPLPLLSAALAIGIHLAAKCLRYRHLTWMIA